MFTQQFVSYAQEFKRRNQNVLSLTFKHRRRISTCVIEFENYNLELRYIKKQGLYFKANTLYSVLYLRKNSGQYYHLTDILPLLERQNFKSCYFWHIEDAQRFEYCFNALLAQFNFVASQLQPFIEDETPLFESLVESYYMTFGLKDGDIDFSNIDTPKKFNTRFFRSLQKTRDGYIFKRFSTFRPYKFVVNKRYYEAEEKYEKLNEKSKLLSYEKVILNRIKNLESEEIVIFDEKCDTTKHFAKIMLYWGFIKAFLVTFLPFAAFFCGGFAFAEWKSPQMAEVVRTIPEWYIGFIPALLCSVFGTLAVFYKMPTKAFKKAERKNVANVVIPKFLRVVANIFFYLAIAAAVLIVAFVMLKG
jgi:hypothetical protein